MEIEQTIAGGTQCQKFLQKIFIKQKAKKIKRWLEHIVIQMDVSFHFWRNVPEMQPRGP